MHWLHDIGLDLYFTREYLKAGVLVSLLSVWVLVGLFFYLNRYTKRRYFTIWTAAWLFYALWITLSFGVVPDHQQQQLIALQRWCIGVSAVFLLWGSCVFLERPVRNHIFGWFLVFLLVWCVAAEFHLRDRFLVDLPIFSIIAASSLFTASSFLEYRRTHQYIGATLLALGFALWGSYMLSYPFLSSSNDLISLALFISAALQLLLAVSMIILVLEEAREVRQSVLAQIKKRTAERDALETRVEETEQRYHQLFDRANEAIIITNKDDLKILELNQAALRLLRLSREDALGQSLKAFCPVKSPTGLSPQLGPDWFQNICRERPLQLVRRNGSTIPLEATGSEVDFGGHPAYQFLFFELTERAKLEQQLRHAEKLSAVGQMISGIAHELNNPLAVVKGYLELVLRHHELKPQTRTDLEKVARESNRAAKLVSQFLSFARGQTSRRELVNLNDNVNRLIESRRFDLAPANTALDLRLMPELPRIKADPDQMDQLLINLIQNALQAVTGIGRPGRVRITTKMVDGRVQTIVEDNGPGVPPELMRKIFEPFFTTKEVGLGTGLGLSITHTIMAEHGGRVYHQPSDLGGAAFVLDFPPVEPASAHPTSGETEMIIRLPLESSAETIVHASILILDDEKSIGEMLGEMLELLNFSPTVCNSAAEALQFIKEKHFDLVISDFRMPGINGEQFHGLVAQRDPDLANKIIFLTGDLVNPETAKFLKSTGNPHLAKPFQLDTVRNAVTAVLKQAHKQGHKLGEVANAC